jgi:microcystin-dependent protein
VPTPFIGELKLVGFNFAPKTWAMANGQLLPINQNAALFSLLGTTYGGNGVNTFALPDMRGRVPMHFGTSSNGTFDQGQVAGVETVTLAINQMPQHTHAFNATKTAGNTAKPAGNLLAGAANTVAGPAFTTPQNQVALTPATIQTAGGSQPHNNIQPYLTVNICIALGGIFPSRQ